MAGAVPVFYWFDRFDERIGVLPAVGAVEHTEELNGEDTLAFCSDEVPRKGDRLLWLDGGRWREHVVVRTVEPVDGLCEVYAESSLCELLCDFIEDMRPTNRTAAQALASVLSSTRWQVGACDVAGTGSCWLYHVNALAAVRRVADLFGAEVQAAIDVEGSRVASRGIELLGRIGAWRGVRLTYGKNMTACTRTVLDEDVYTALYGYGAGLPATDSEGNHTGGYRRKLNFGELNGGANWVGDEDAREVWGRWNAERTEKVHSFGQVTFPQCTDAEELLALTRRALLEAVQPKVSYEVDAANLEGNEVELGDEVAVIDTSRSPEWRLRARVVRRVRTFLDGVRTRVTIGTVQPVDYATVSSLSGDVAVLQDDVVGIDGQLSAVATTEFVEQHVTDAIDAIEDLGNVSF